MRLHLARGFSLAATLAFLAAPSVTFADSFQIKGYNTGTFVGPGASTPAMPWTVTSLANGGSQFTWGKANSGNDSPNSLKYTPINYDAGTQFDTLTNTPIQLGELSYYNGITALGSTVDSVDLIVSLTLTVPNVGLTTYDFAFEMLTRTNPAPDDVTFVSPTTSTTFNVDGVDYTLKLLGFSDTGGEPFRDAFLSQGENMTSTTGLWAEVTAAVPAVPEPASIAIVAVAGAFGLAHAARRRRNASPD